MSKKRQHGIEFKSIEFEWWIPDFFFPQFLDDRSFEVHLDCK